MCYFLTRHWKACCTQLVLVGIAVVSGASLSCGEVLFEQDFETGQFSSDPSPVWSWVDAISESDPSSITTATMVGPDDIYSISDDMAFGGNYSWRLNFAGRNNWCNQCGAIDAVITEDEIDNSCMVVDGESWATTVFNKTNGFSRWNVTSYTSTEVCFDGNTAVADSLFSETGFTEGDTIKIPYLCDVNGVVGGNINRRSDCNKAINYLTGVRSSDFEYGETLSRRFYLYIPSETTLPDVTLKLGYAHFRRDDSLYATTLKLSVQRNLQLELSLPGGISVPNYYVEKDKWYYFEEVWTRESAESMTDGNYKLYVSPADSVDESAVVEQTDIEIGSINDMSFNGNFQHYEDSSGYIYFDNIVIADGYTGPVEESRSVTLPWLLLLQ